MSRACCFSSLTASNVIRLNCADNSTVSPFIVTLLIIIPAAIISSIIRFDSASLYLDSLGLFSLVCSTLNNLSLSYLIVSNESEQPMTPIILHCKFEGGCSREPVERCKKCGLRLCSYHFEKHSCRFK